MEYMTRLAGRTAPGSGWLSGRGLLPLRTFSEGCTRHSVAKVMSGSGVGQYTGEQRMVSLTLSGGDPTELVFSSRFRITLSQELSSIGGRAGDRERSGGPGGGFYSIPLRGFLPTLFCIKKQLCWNVNHRLSGNWVVGSTYAAVTNPLGLWEWRGVIPENK